MISTRYPVGSAMRPAFQKTPRFNGQQARHASATPALQQPRANPLAKTLGAMLIGLSTMMALPGCTSKAVKDFDQQYNATATVDSRFDVLKTGLQSPQSDVRERALGRINELNVNDGKKLELVKQALTDVESGIRMQALELLGGLNISGGEKLEQLNQSFNDQVTGIRSKTLTLVSKLNVDDKDKLAFYTKAQQDRDVTVRGAIPRLVQPLNIPTNDKVAILEKALADSSDDIRLVANTVTQELDLPSPEKLKLLGKAMDDTNRNVRAQALEFTRKLDASGKDKMPIFEKGFRDREANVRAAALAAVLDITNLPAKVELPFLLDGLLDNSEEIREMANKRAIYYESRKNPGVTEGISMRMQNVRELRPRVKEGTEDVTVADKDENGKEIRDTKTGKVKTHIETVKTTKKLGDEKRFRIAVEDFKGFVSRMP